MFRVLFAGLLALCPVACEGFADDGNPETCLEDEACWDCRTMGNRICGPEAG
jgi:hypothetical protein